MPSFVLKAVNFQVQAVLDEIERLEGSEFPYDHVKEGLDEIRELFLIHAKSLSQLDEHSKPDTVAAACKTAFSSVQGSLEFLGFILRATNVRNAFEVYGPLLRMCRQLLGSDTRLIISSEWNFSPFTFIGYEALPDFVLIGLPATESSNPFLLPLAGHELGHSAWVAFSADLAHRKQIEDHIVDEIKQRLKEYDAIFPGRTSDDLTTDFFVRQTWASAWKWAMRQAEELFCDFIGLRLFGESYLHAFAFLLAPPIESNRSVQYPNITERAKVLERAATEFGLRCPMNYSAMFTDDCEPKDDQMQMKFLLSVADEARRHITADLLRQAEKTVLDAGIAPPTPEQLESCKARFRLMIPASRVGNLAAILNAAWDALNSETPFFDNPRHDQRRKENLTEIVLKSIEVHEIEQKLATSS